MLFKTLVAIVMSIAVFGVAVADTIPGEQATKAGFKTCQKTVEKVAKFLTDGTEHGAVSVWNNKAPDGRIFNSQIALKVGDMRSFAALNVAQADNGRCDGSYTRLFVVESSCSVLRETTFKDWKFSGEIAGLVTLENSSGGVTTMLLPNKTGCVAIQTEVIYE